MHASLKSSAMLYSNSTIQKKFSFGVGHQMNSIKKAFCCSRQVEPMQTTVALISSCVPLDDFFQVTETVDVGKYFLDIDKVQRYPITFVVKTEETKQTLMEKLRIQAVAKYGIRKVVERYMDCIEEIINVPLLISHFDTIVAKGK